MLRWRIGLSRISTLIGDLFFSIISVFVIFYFAQKANYLELRFYLFGGSLLGLLVYISYISKYVKRLINMILNIVSYLANRIYSLLRSLFGGAGSLLSYLMGFPYAILRWLGLLLFRMGEAIGKEAYSRAKVRIGRYPRE